ncbi:MAG: hypothetical protein RJA98_3312 [Pseudomonadota bacterium]|jgi:hypothetical protein
MIRTLSIRSACAATSLFALAAVPLAAHAESSYQTGAGALAPTAHLDFKITIPKVLFLRVGTGTDYTTVGTINLIDFTVPAANVGDGSVISASAGAGDLGTGKVTAKLVTNGGDVTFASKTTGAMNNGTAAETISYSQIATAVATNTTATALTHPALVDAAAGTSVTVTAVNKVVNQDAKWTFTYLNANVAPAGTYGGVNTNNGRVTYTASVL